MNDPLYYDESKTELHVKFNDEQLIRTSVGGVFGSNAAEVAVINTVLRQHGFSSVEPLISSEAGRANALDLMMRAQNRSSQRQPDLLSLYHCVFTQLPNATVLLRAATILDSLPSVEYVHLAPKYIPPPVLSEAGILMRCESESTHFKRRTTPNFEVQQRYRGPDPGFDADFANDLGANGAGVRLSDCEYSWDYDHEDVYPLHAEPGYTADPSLFPDHGTASVGVSKGVLNGFGITGVAREADIYTYAESTLEHGYNRIRAITAAVADSREGDVVLLEMQTRCCGRLEYSPAETDPSVWMVTKAATDAGIIVVSAAGNGNEDLDSPPYSEYMNRGDSGAIIVGAGIATKMHSKASFSTYGSRVDVQAWGDWSVMTAGYGVCAFAGSDLRQRLYTNGFSGTSSASALVAGAVASLQSWANKRLRRRLIAKEMREVLETTGIPQAAGDKSNGQIGPQIHMKKAIESLQPGGRWGVLTAQPAM
jgi:hypothetical protein